MHFVSGTSRFHLRLCSFALRKSSCGLSWASLNTGLPSHFYRLDLLGQFVYEVLQCIYTFPVCSLACLPFGLFDKVWMHNWTSLLRQEALIFVFLFPLSIRSMHGVKIFQWSAQWFRKCDFCSIGSVPCPIIWGSCWCRTSTVEPFSSRQIGIIVKIYLLKSYVTHSAAPPGCELQLKQPLAEWLKGPLSLV